MDFTYLDYFNYYLKEFCNEIIANFPDYEKAIVDNYRSLLETKQSKNDLYVKYFISKVNPYMEDICNCNTEFFVPLKWYNETTQVQGTLYLLEGVDFISLWNSSHNNETTQKAIWKYLQLLVLLGRKIVPNKTEILDILNNVGGQVYAPAKVEKTLNSEPDDLDDVGNKPDLFGLGNLASLASLAGIGGGGSGGMPDISSLVKNVGDMLGNFNFEDMAKSMATDDNTIPEEDDDKTTDETTESTTPTTETSSDEELTDSTTNLFTDLAKDMADTFDFSSMENEQPKNMGEMFSKFLSGDNPSKLMGLVSKFGAKLQQDVSSGKINQQDLLRDTAKMMSGLQGGDASKLKKQAQKMAAANPALAQQMAQMRNNSGNATRDRLRAKLEAKKAQQESNNESQSK
jgi:hypothetical protein